ncbi:MAG: hypothetical protein OHK0050_28070 [Roseiflexaceae bacterium]
MDAVIIWDMLCGTSGRICPKLTTDPGRTTLVAEKLLPPPCIYLFPKNIPDPRNNPTPKPHKIGEVLFIERLYRLFRCQLSDIVEVRIEADTQNNNTVRRTICVRDGAIVKESRWTQIKRAR